MTGVVKIRLSLVIKFALTKPSGKIFSTTSCDCPGSFSGKLTVSSILFSRSFSETLRRIEVD